MIKPNFRLAHEDDLASLTEMINQAYRSNTGQSWTNEAAIIEGLRITQAQLQESMRQLNFEIWVLEGKQENPLRILGCIGLTKNLDSVEIGSFCIDPFLQNMGLGKALLNFAERYVEQNYSEIKVLDMYVLNVRSELIAFYERCGYTKTLNIEDYPIDANVGVPLVDLHLVHLQKRINSLTA